MTIYLGPIGNLQALPSIGRGITASLDLGASVQRTLGGARTVDYIGTPRRTYSLQRAWLTADELSVMEALAYGAYGPGPFALIDPWRRNLLTANQSSGSDVLADATDMFTTAAVTSSTSQASTGARSYAWAVTAASSALYSGLGAAATLTLTDPHPVVRPTLSYVAQAKARLSTSTGTLTVGIRWYDTAGASVSDSTGSATALATGAWTTVSVTATAPTTAAYGRLRIINTVMGAAQTIYLDDLMLSQASTVEAWTLGTGVPRVAFTELSDAYPIYPYHDGSFTLQEVG